MDERLVFEPERKLLTGISRVTARQMEKRGEFPRRRRVGAQKVAWLFSEIQQWIAERPVVSLKEAR